MPRLSATAKPSWLTLLLVLTLSLNACSSKKVELTLNNLQLYSLDAGGNQIISSTFATTTKQIVARFDLVTPTYPVTIVERLYYLDAASPTGAKQDFLVTEGELTSQYAGSHQMAATRPEKLWPQGSYKIELYQKDQYDKLLGLANFVVL